MKTRKTSRILALLLGGGMLMSAASAEAAFRWPWEKKQEDKRPAPTAPVPQRDLPGKTPRTDNPTNPLPTAANPIPKTAAQHEDASILQKLHEMNLEQVEMSELALQRAQNPKVKAFARNLLTDHRSADTVIRERAKNLTVALREERKPDASEIRRQVGRLPGKSPERVEPPIERTKGVDELTELNGAAFDTTYLARSMELYDVVRAEFAAFKAEESGEFHDQLATHFDKLVKHRAAAKKLHDEIRNDAR